MDVGVFAYLHLRGKVVGMKRSVLLSASVVLMILVGSGVALAALSDIPDPDTPGANGRVSDILVAGDTIYLAGSFTQVTDKNGTFTRNNLAAIDADTGAVTAWDPNAQHSTGNSSVRTMALSADGSRLFVGGNFTSVGGLTRNRLAAIDPATGEVDRDWKGAGVNNVVLSLAVSGDRLYLGGTSPRSSKNRASTWRRSIPRRRRSTRCGHLLPPSRMAARAPCMRWTSPRTAPVFTSGALQHHLRQQRRYSHGEAHGP